MRTKLGLVGLIVSVISLFSSPIWGQTREVGVRFGLANYRGELAPVFNIITPRIHAGLFYRANLGKEWSLKVNAIYSQLAADDKNSEDVFALRRDHRFETNLWEFSGQVEYNFLNFRSPRTRIDEDNWTPYLFAGLGVFKMDPRLNQQETYETLGAVIPMGVGIKAILGPQWNIGLEFGSRFTFTDFIDDLGVDVNPNVSLDPKFYSGNPNNNDMYFYTMVGISFVFPDPGTDCPVKLPR